MTKSAHVVRHLLLSPPCQLRAADRLCRSFEADLNLIIQTAESQEHGADMQRCNQEDGTFDIGIPSAAQDAKFVSSLRTPQRQSATVPQPVDTSARFLQPTQSSASGARPIPRSQRQDGKPSGEDPPTKEALPFLTARPGAVKHCAATQEASPTVEGRPTTISDNVSAEALDPTQRHRLGDIPFLPPGDSKPEQHDAARHVEISRASSRFDSEAIPEPSNWISENAPSLESRGGEASLERSRAKEIFGEHVDALAQRYRDAGPEFAPAHATHSPGKFYGCNGLEPRAADDSKEREQLTRMREGADKDSVSEGQEPTTILDGAQSPASFGFLLDGVEVIKVRTNGPLSPALDTTLICASHSKF